MSTKPDSQKVLDEALQLEPTARAFIAETLLESLELEHDFPVPEEWREQVRRRCLEIDNGRTGMFDDAAVLNELRAKYA
ncbi:MAG TPA: addiction module protein [Burkholderiales bacterium]